VAGGIEIQQPFDGFYILDRVVIKLASQLKKEKRGRKSPEKQQDCGKYAQIPNRQSCADTLRAAQSRHAGL